MLIALASVLLFLSVATLAWALLPNEANRRMRRRIYSEVAGTKDPSPLTKLIEVLAAVHRRAPTGWYTERVTKLMESAGKQRVPAIHFLVIQEMGAAAGLLLYFVCKGTHQPIDWMWFVGCAAAGFLLPAFWLQNQIKQRRMTVSRDLPEVVDLLTLCVGAGGDFMGALNRIVREFRPCPVREELGILMQEVRVGKRRRDALRAFATRLQTPEAMTFARTLIQVDRMGTGLDDALTILSEDMRLQRYHWAERFAQQAPMKMLVPLLFSLGAAMVIVAGPILIQFFRGGLMSAPKMSAESQQAK